MLRPPISPRPSAAINTFVVLICLPAAAAEPETIPDQTARRLLEAVAERGYHDTSLLILDRLDDDQDLSDEFRRMIPLRRAAALVASVHLDPDLSKRQQVYADARVEIDRLLSTSDDPGMVSEASLQRGLLLLEQGRLLAATANVIGTTVAALLAVAAGLQLGRLAG